MAASTWISDLHELNLSSSFGFDVFTGHPRYLVLYIIHGCFFGGQTVYFVLGARR
jgi:hypothetical protein